MKAGFSIGLAALFFLTARVHGSDLELRTPRDGKWYRVQVALDGENLLKSPPEGLWSIATGWKESWPVSWLHAGPSEVEHVGDWTIVRGKLETSAATWQLSDSYRPEGRIIKCIRRFRWDAIQTAERVTLSVRFQCPGKGSMVVLPGILYHGNPSGARSGRVPVYSGKPGEEAVYEEHRFPMPYASLEWSAGGGLLGAAMHSLPSPVPFGRILRPGLLHVVRLRRKAVDTEAES